MLVKLEQMFGYAKMLMVIPSAHFLPNPMLAAAFFGQRTKNKYGKVKILLRNSKKG